MRIFRLPGILFFILFISPVIVSAQGENNIWTFGDSLMLNFNVSPPALTTNVSSLFSIEGASSISDAAGNLLFYSNGNTVWDRNHNAMPNGTGLLGNGPFAGQAGSSTQGVAIVPVIGAPSQYYVFVLEAAEEYMFGSGMLRYSVVDMNLNSGLGDVIATQKNVPLDYDLSEKMTVIKGDGCYYWLVVHKLEEEVYHSFKIDASGINPFVASNTGVMGSGLWNYVCGEMKISPDRTKIASVSTGSTRIELANFDVTTGIVSNAQTVDSTTGPGFITKYGVEFSPDNSKLYVATWIGLWQYDLSLLPNIAAVQASKIVLSPVETDGMRRAPDNKIYVAMGWNNWHIGVINNPNMSGTASNFNPNTFVLPANVMPKNGIGNNVAVIYPDTVTAAHDTVLCLAGSVTVNAPSGYNSYLWSDGTTLATNVYTGPGTKWVQAANACQILIDTITVSIGPGDTTTFSTDTAMCINPSVSLQAPGGFFSYVWDDGTMQQSNTFTAPGTYWVQSWIGCDLRLDTFHLSPAPLAETSYTTDTAICFNLGDFTATAPSGYSSYLWDDGSIGSTNTYSAAGTVWVQSMSECSIRIDTFHISDLPLTVTSFVTDTTVCFNQSSYTVSAPAGYTSYLWDNGTISSTNSFSGPGTKWVESLTGCDLRRDTFHIGEAPLDTFIVVRDTAVCFYQTSYTAQAPPGYSVYTWDDGTTSATSAVTGPGTRWLEAREGCDLRIDTFHFSSAPLNTTTAITDTSICFNQGGSFTAQGVAGSAIYLWDDGTTNQTNIFTSPGTRWVQSTLGCDQHTDTFVVTASAIDTVFQVSDTTLCFNGQVMLPLFAAPGYNNYLWSDGATTPFNSITTPGLTWVYASTGCSVAVDSFYASAMTTDTTTSHTDRISCFTDPLTLAAPAGYNYYLWSDGSNTPAITINQSSTVWVYSELGCEARLDSFKVRLGDFYISLGNDTAICKGDQILLDATVTDAGYTWQDTSNQSILYAVEPGVYWVDVQVGNCHARDTVVIAEKKIAVTLPEDLTLCEQEILEVKASLPNSSYLWQDGSSDQSYTVSAPGNYWVQVNQGNCVTSDSINVGYEKCDCSAFIPTAFTPNQDGKNDEFGPLTLCDLTAYQFAVFDRWGNKVFSSFRKDDKWNGNFKGAPAQLGTYFYYLEYTGTRGKTYSYKGDITLLR